jgi:two-component system nitrate/nitrite response regulator NarL
MINISIISRHEGDYKSISTALESEEDLHIVSVGKDGYDAIKAADSFHPDVCIMDFSMKDNEGLSLAPIIKRRSPKTALIVLCSRNEQSAVAKALRAGISGYLLREDGFAYLAESVRSVFYGGLYISKSAKKHTIDCLSTPIEVLSPDSELPPHSFTLTELGIFYGITRGETDREIAKNLNMSIGSLRNCVNQVKKKTGLRNRTQISLYALFTGKLNIGQLKDTFL